jgi:hypothetical protein
MIPSLLLILVFYSSTQEVMTRKNATVFRSGGVNLHLWFYMQENFIHSTPKGVITMKKILALCFAVSILTTLSFAAITSLTLDWSATNTGFTANPSYGRYNWDTGHFLHCDYGNAAAWQVRIASGTTGVLTGSTLPKGSINVGASTLGVFAIAIADDGKIYGHVDALTGGGVGASIAIWQSETDASPTQQDPATGGPGNLPLQFARAMHAVGSGVDTIVAVTGNDEYRVTFLTTTDGTTFAVTDHTPVGGAGTNLIKQDVYMVAESPLDVVYGTKNDGSANLSKIVKEAGVWVAPAEWAPPPVGNITGTGTDPGNCSPIAYVAGHNEVLVISTNAAAPASDKMYVLDGETGAYTGVSMDVNAQIGLFGYGSIDVDPSTGTGFFTARTDTAGSPVTGQFSFDIYVPPTPTPIPVAADPAWGLYE